MWLPWSGPRRGWLNIYLAMSTFSPPLSVLTLEGRPNFSTAPRKSWNTVAAWLFVLSLKENNHTGVTINPPMNDEAPPNRNRQGYNKTIHCTDLLLSINIIGHDSSRFLIGCHRTMPRHYPKVMNLWKHKQFQFLNYRSLPSRIKLKIVRGTVEKTCFLCHSFRDDGTTVGTTWPWVYVQMNVENGVFFLRPQPGVWVINE